MARRRGGAADRGRDRPGRPRQRLPGRGRRLGGDRRPQRVPAADRGRAAAAVHGRARLPARALPRRGAAARDLGADPAVDHGRLVRLGAPHRADRRRGHGRAPGDLRHERRRHLHLPDRPADREAAGRPGAHRRPGDHLPRDRRARAPGAAARAARRQRARDGALAPGGHAPARGVGDRLLVADRGEPGRDPARLERGHPRVPLGREGDGDDDDVLGAARLRGDRAPPRDRDRPADRRRREPRQPPLGRGRRGDPHGQQDGGREEAATPAIARSTRTASTSRASSSSSSGRSCSSCPRPRARRAATSARAATAAGSTRSCAQRCAWPCGT